MLGVSASVTAFASSPPEPAARSGALFIKAHPNQSASIDESADIEPTRQGFQTIMSYEATVLLNMERSTQSLQSRDLFAVSVDCMKFPRDDLRRSSRVLGEVFSLFSQFILNIQVFFSPKINKRNYAGSFFARKEL